jgi:hypothetical protein
MLIKSRTFFLDFSKTFLDSALYKKIRMINKPKNKRSKMKIYKYKQSKAQTKFKKSTN